MGNNIDTTQLEKLSRNLEQAMKEFPEERRAAHEKVGQMLEKRLKATMSARLNTRNKNPKGVIGWQEVHVGSKGGYAAIRPAKTPSGKNGAGAITNYLESGHKIRRPSGKAKRLQKSRIRVAYVAGRYFYRDTAREISQNAEQIMKELAQTMAKKIEGN